MADSFEIQPETLRTGAAVFAREAPNLEEAVERLRSTLSGLGEPWGDDDPGRQFGSSYEPNAKALMNAISTLAEGLASTGDGLAAMADNYDRSEAASSVPGG